MSVFSGTEDVAKELQFSVEKFSEWAKNNVPEMNSSAPITVKKFKGGQSNPTYLISQADQSFVLRRKPPGNLLPSAHAVDREFKVIQSLSKHDFPVARPVAYCKDLEIIGSEFYLMDFVEGRIFWDPLLPELNNQQRPIIFEQMNSVIAKMHSLDPIEIGLGDYGRFGGYVQRQIERWSKQYRASETEKIPAMDNLMDWLPQHIPHYDSTRLVHGDYRLDNMIFDPKTLQVIAVLDWELSTLGNPLSDFAYHVMNWRLSPAIFRGIAGEDIARLNIPDEKTYVQSYLKKTGFEIESAKDWEFYIVFNMFRLVAILQGVMARALQGNASSDQAIDSGKRARPLAELAWEQVLKI
jgi:aminoglycoside phosphotransferase (APT) family kinase protein